MSEKECDPEVYSKGKVVAVAKGFSKELIEEICKDASQKTGQKVDWHFASGRYIIKVLGNEKMVAEFLIPFECDWFKRAAEHHTVMAELESHAPKAKAS